MTMPRALLLLCLAWGCVSATDPAGRGLLGACAFNDDCASPLLCAAGRCRAPCRTDRDCANDGRCLSAGTPSAWVCYAPDDYANGCVWDSHCRGGRVCGGDRVCRAQCREDYDCAVLAPGLRCLASGVCSAHPFLDDAGLLRDVDLNLRDARAASTPTGAHPRRGGSPPDGGAPVDAGVPTDAIPLGDSGFGAAGDEPTVVTTTGCGPSADARSCTPGAPGCEVAALVPTGVSDSRCVRFVDGSVRCWGTGRNGILGIGPYPAQCFAPFVAQRLHGASSIMLGGASGCALFRRGVWCWGSNLDGSVGNGATTPVLVPTAIGEAPMGDGALVAGLGRNVCHLAASGVLRCWGQNTSGQLAQGDLTARTRAVTVPLIEVTDVGLGTSHACAVRRDGSVWCWGTNCGGECGREPAVTPGGLYRDPCLEVVTSPLRVPGITDAREVAVGPHVSCARRASGEVVLGMERQRRARARRRRGVRRGACARVGSQRRDLSGRQRDQRRGVRAARRPHRVVLGHRRPRPRGHRLPHRGREGHHGPGHDRGARPPRASEPARCATTASGVGRGSRETARRSTGWSPLASGSDRRVHGGADTVTGAADAPPRGDALGRLPNPVRARALASGKRLSAPRFLAWPSGCSAREGFAGRFAMRV